MAYEGFVDQYEEHCEFEATAEDMELRAMRLEAEQETELEAHWDALEAEEEERQFEARREAAEDAYYEGLVEDSFETPDERAMTFADEPEGEDIEF